MLMVDIFADLLDRILNWDLCHRNIRLRIIQRNI